MCMWNMGDLSYCLSQGYVCVEDGEVITLFIPRHSLLQPKQNHVDLTKKKEPWALNLNVTRSSKNNMSHEEEKY